MDFKGSYKFVQQQILYTGTFKIQHLFDVYVMFPRNSHLWNTAGNFEKLSPWTLKNQFIKEKVFIFWCQAQGMEWDMAKRKKYQNICSKKMYMHLASRTSGFSKKKYILVVLQLNFSLDKRIISIFIY